MRHLLNALLAIACLAGACTSAGDAPGAFRASSAEPPNVVIIVTDDQRLETLETMPKTLRWMQRGGTRYTNAYVTTPLCCPSRSSIMTGRYAHNHGVRINPAGSRLDESTTLQHHLQRAGYRTGMFGKFLSGRPFTEDPRYFDSWGVMDHHSRYSGARWNLDGDLRRVDAYATRFIGQLARNFIERAEAQNDAAPWFLYLAPPAPHAPRIPEPRYAELPVPPWSGNPAIRERDRSDKPPYVREAAETTPARAVRSAQIRTLASVDDLVGNLFSTLETHREERQTLVFYLSDNGYLWSEHGMPTNFMAKSNPYTQSIQVPMLVRWPGHLPHGEIDDRLVANIDIVPTILDAANIADEELRALDGKSLLSDSKRTRLLTEYWTSNESPIPDWASIVTRSYQYTEYYDPQDRPVFREYYDLFVDPWQLNNLLADVGRSDSPPSAEVRKLHEMLIRDRSCRGSSCP
jgi:arylsulfatase A-like enzyme